MALGRNVKLVRELRGFTQKNFPTGQKEKSVKLRYLRLKVGTANAPYF